MPKFIGIYQTVEEAREAMANGELAENCLVYITDNNTLASAGEALDWTSLASKIEGVVIYYWTNDGQQAQLNVTDYVLHTYEDGKGTIVLPAGTTTVPENLFVEPELGWDEIAEVFTINTSLTRVVLGDEFKTVNDDAFKGQLLLGDLNLNFIDSIALSAVYGCGTEDLASELGYDMTNNIVIGPNVKWMYGDIQNTDFNTKFDETNPNFVFENGCISKDNVALVYGYSNKEGEMVERGAIPSNVKYLISSPYRDSGFDYHKLDSIPYCIPVEQAKTYDDVLAAIAVIEETEANAPTPTRGYWDNIEKGYYKKSIYSDNIVNPEQYKEIFDLYIISRDVYFDDTYKKVYPICKDKNTDELVPSPWISGLHPDFWTPTIYRREADGEMTYLDLTDDALASLEESGAISVEQGSYFLNRDLRNTYNQVFGSIQGGLQKTITMVAPNFSEDGAPASSTSADTASVNINSDSFVKKYADYAVENDELVMEYVSSFASTNTFMRMPGDNAVNNNFQYLDFCSYADYLSTTGAAALADTVKQVDFQQFLTWFATTSYFTDYTKTLKIDHFEEYLMANNMLYSTLRNSNGGAFMSLAEYYSQTNPNCGKFIGYKCPESGVPYNSFYLATKVGGALIPKHITVSQGVFDGSNQYKANQFEYICILEDNSGVDVSETIFSATPNSYVYGSTGKAVIATNAQWDYPLTNNYQDGGSVYYATLSI